MVEKNVENPFELLAPYLVTSPDGRTLNTENAPNGKLVTAVRLAAAEGRVKDAIRLFERVPFSQRKTNHRREMRNGLVKMIESENTSVEELIEISERIRNNWMLPGTEGDAMGIVLEELGKCESIDRVAAVFDALKHKDYFYDLLQTNPNCKRPLALSIAKQIPKAKSPEERDKRIADVATVLFVAPEEEVRAVEEYRQIIYRLCDNDVALAIHVLPQIEDSIVAREFATSIVSQILRNYPDDKLAIDKLEKLLDSNTIDDLLGVAFMTQLQHFLADKSGDSDNKRKVNIAAKIIALSFPSDPSLPSHSGAVILEFIYCSYALPLSAIQTITEHLQNEPRVNLTFDQMNHIKEKLAKLKMEERTEFVEVLKKQSKTVQRWQNSSLQELEAELDRLMEKEGSTWVVMAAVLCREIVNKVGSQTPMNVSDAIRILEDIQIRRGKMKELMGEMESADRKRAESVMRTVLDKAYNRLANAAFTRAGNEDGLEQLDKLWNLGIGSSLRADNLLFYISRLYLGGRLENASAVGEVLRETGQSVIGDTFEKLGRRLALFDIAKIDSLTSYLSDTFGFPHNSVLRLKANIVQNEIKALIKSDKAEEAFELCKKLALQNHKTVGQFELMNEALRTENRELLEKVVQLVASQNGQSAAVYDMIYSILDCRLIDKWKDRIKNLIERQPNEIDSRMMGYFVGKASGDKRPDILRNIFELMREKVSIVDMNNVLETLIKLYYRSNDFESIKSLEEEIRKTNYPLKNNTEKWLAKMHKACCGFKNLRIWLVTGRGRKLRKSMQNSEDDNRNNQSCACSSQSTRSQEKSPNPQCHANTSRIDPYCENETWECIKESKVQKALDPLKPINEPTPADRDKFLKVVCISDTHEQLDKFKERGIPDGDVLIHAGDFVNQGSSEKIEEFNQILGTLPHRTKIVVAGNHELGFDPIEADFSSLFQIIKPFFNSRRPKCAICRTLVNGVKFYGASNHPLPSYPFYTARGQEMQYAWSKIPANTDVLITHTPPLGYMDTFTSNWGPERWGCKDLLTVVERIKPKFVNFFF
ncbi:hypothetical protein WR25_09497 isoform C [Diploscapter pachys]|uniref:Calcineurin-like phosphoesterase domain-containing protein n=1 Tax=Diploscapter pachys TaxID=2018661 RepID=A0A2A2K2V9_9BILA|nr:hypothetical protein WR25_09497 isoform C [Diploscapter pachys]